MENVRLLTPVSIGSRIRGNFRLVSAEERAPGKVLIGHSAIIKRENPIKPALLADWLVLALN